MIKSSVFATFLVATLSTLSSPVFSADARYTLDPAHTTVAFLIDHVGFAKTLGQFTDVSGTFSYDSDTQQVSDVSIVVKTASVESFNKARDKHVRNKDFLNTKKYPEMVFTATEATLAQDGSGTVNGELELLGQTLPLALTVTLNKAEAYPFGHKRFTLGVSASGALKRSAYGMEYGVANALVGDEVQIIIETEAIQDK